MESITQKGLYLFWLFFKGMMFAFTGGMTALPTIEKGIVDKKNWMTKKEFWTYPALGQTLPGVISIHNSILIGNRIAGPFGAFMALLGVITPPFVFMLVIAALFQTVVNNSYIQGMIRGIRVISVALLLGNGIRLLTTVPGDAFSIIIVIIAVTVPLFFGFSPFWTIVVCGAAGIISILLNPAVIKRETGPEQENEE